MLGARGKTVPVRAGSSWLIQEYTLEGAFRSVHTRLRTHAESIAFFGGGEREGTTINGYFDRLLQHRRSVIDIR